MKNQVLKEITIGQLPAGSIFKIGLMCNAYLWAIFGLILGLFAFAGYDTVSWNNEQVHGIGGLIIGFFLAAVFALIGAVFLMLGGMLASFVSRLKGGGVIAYIEDADTSVPVDAEVTAAE